LDQEQDCIVSDFAYLICGLRYAGPWAVVKGNISSRQGRDLYFSPTVDFGHSGGPIIQDGKVVGLVTVAGQSSGRGVIAKKHP
jgi:hypothetical protein